MTASRRECWSMPKRWGRRRPRAPEPHDRTPLHEIELLRPGGRPPGHPRFAPSAAGKPQPRAAQDRASGRAHRGAGAGAGGGGLCLCRGGASAGRALCRLPRWADHRAFRRPAGDDLGRDRGAGGGDGGAGGRSRGGIPFCHRGADGHPADCRRVPCNGAGSSGWCRIR